METSLQAIREFLHETAGEVAEEASGLTITMAHGEKALTAWEERRRAER